MMDSEEEYYDPVFEFEAPQWCDLLNDNYDDNDNEWFERLHLGHEADFMMTFVNIKETQQRITNSTQQIINSYSSKRKDESTIHVDASPKRGITLREEKASAQYSKDQFLFNTLDTELLQGEDFKTHKTPPKEEQNNLPGVSPFKPKLKRFGLSGPARRGGEVPKFEYNLEQENELEELMYVPDKSALSSSGKQRILPPPVRVPEIDSIAFSIPPASVCPSSPSASIYSPPVRHKRPMRYTTTSAKLSSLAALSSLPANEPSVFSASSGLLNIGSSPLAKGTTAARQPFGIQNINTLDNNNNINNNVNNIINKEEKVIMKKPIKKSSLATVSTVATSEGKKTRASKTTSTTTTKQVKPIAAEEKSITASTASTRSKTRTTSTTTTTATTTSRASATSKKTTASSTTTATKKPSSRTTTRSELLVTKAASLPDTKATSSSKAAARRRRTDFPTDLGDDDEDDDLKNLLDQHNSKFKTSKKTVYQPRVHSYQDIRKWEKRNNKTWYDLSPTEREAANAEISLMKKVNAKHGS